MSKTKNEILDLAEGLLRTRGYHGFSYKDISVPLDIKNAAIHYHFPSKEDLGLAVIERTLDAFRVKTADWMIKSPVEKINLFIAVYEKSQKNNMVCIMGALGPSFDTLPDKMQESLTKTSLEIKTWLASVLEDGMSSGEFNFMETIKEKTDLIISSLLSSLILNKITQEDILYSVKGSILKSI